jgi:hypothetical protein
MTTALMTHTQITYQFTVTVNVNVNADKALLLLFACIAYAFWTVRRCCWAVSLLLHDVAEAVAFTATVVVIGWKALLFGLVGVRL